MRVKQCDDEYDGFVGGDNNDNDNDDNPGDVEALLARTARLTSGATTSTAIAVDGGTSNARMRFKVIMRSCFCFFLFGLFLFLFALFFFVWKAVMIALQSNYDCNDSCADEILLLFFGSLLTVMFV